MALVDLLMYQRGGEPIESLRFRVNRFPFALNRTFLTPVLLTTTLGTPSVARGLRAETSVGVVWGNSTLQ